MKKQFSQSEIEAIIKKASRLQEQEERHVSEMNSGLSLEELKELGKDAGLDPRYIQAAAAEYDGSVRKRFSGFSDTHIFEERVVDTPLEEVDWNLVRDELMHHFGTLAGKVVENEDKKEWTHTAGSGIESRASLVGNHQSYKLRLSQRVGMGSTLTEGLVYGGVIASIIGMFMMAGLDLSLVEKIASFTGLFVGCSSGVYALDKAWRRKKLRLLSELADRLVETIRFSSVDEVEKSEKRVPESDKPLLDGELSEGDVSEGGNRSRLKE